MKVAESPSSYRPRLSALTLVFACALFAVTAQAKSGFFAAGSVGSSGTKVSPTALARIADEEPSFALGIGYAFNPYFAIQGAYHDFGQVTGVDGCPPGPLCLPPVDCPPDFVCTVMPLPPVQVDVTGWSARLTGSLPFGGRFAAIASVGVISWDMSADLVASNSGVLGEDLDDSGPDLIYEAGLEWHLSDRWSLRASYERVELDIESTKVGATFRF